MSIIKEIIESYKPKSISEMKFALREIMQSIILIGLSRTNFFSRASFYGGTALRIFYNLNRFSEDLDFTLNDIDNDFTIEPYIQAIKNTALSYNLDFDISTKIKQITTPIESAFAKVNTYHTFISLKLNDELLETLHKDETLKVKLEIDCKPPLGFNTEIKWLDSPEFAPIIVLDAESLFAGKIHAILCRSFKNNVKGRDYYDFLFYIRKKIKPNLTYLKNKLIDTHKISKNEPFTIDILKKMLIDKFNTVDFNQVKKDAERFVITPEDLSFYSKELFIQMTEKL